MRFLCALIVLAALSNSSCADEEIHVSAIVGATSDYVYRGVSQRDGQPTPLAYVSLKWQALYVEGFLVGVDLGEDALGRAIGTTEADMTVGITPRWKNVEFNFGAKYTGYPNGRDIVVASLVPAERDFIEPFAAASVNITEAFAFGATAYWTPDFYDETGEVRTLEAKASLTLPSLGPLNTKLTAQAGKVHSANVNVVCPGDTYRYYAIGIEGQLDRLVFDVRYWDTDVDDFEAFGERLVLSAGVTF